jgi:hypothetical protein
LKEYSNAIKCFKRQLEIAWDSNNVSGEISAYDCISLQYFYLGDMDKAKFYHDRMLRGKCETKMSKIRKIYEDHAANRRSVR